MSDELTAHIDLPVRPDEAFELFTAGFARWWPREFSWSGAEDLADIGVEPRQDGALYEIGPHGLRWDWGRVLVWEPPTILTFSWQIGPDRVPIPRAEDATEVEVTFTSATTIHVTHRHWARHGDQGTQYREAFQNVWPYALDRLASL